MTNVDKNSNQETYTVDEFVGKYSCGLIASFKVQNSLEQNEKNTKDMIKALKDNGYRVAEMEGSYLERDADEEFLKNEISLFVVNQQVPVDDGGQLEKHLIELGKQHGIESILSIRKGNSNLIRILTEEDQKLRCGESKYLGKAQFGKEVGQKTYRVKGRPFGFGKNKI